MNHVRVVKSARSAARAEILVKNHRLHLGLYRRVANKLRLDASYVSKVASGVHKSERVMLMLLSELIGLHERQEETVRSLIVD